MASLSTGNRAPRLFGASRSSGSGVWRRRGGGWLAFGMLATGLMVGATACASGGSSSPGSEDVWREDMGRMPRTTVAAGIDRVVGRHGLRIDRQEDRSREFFYEFAWMPRDVTAEEEIFGVTDARNRVIIRGRTSGAAGVATAPEAYRVTWELQNEVVSVANPEWHPGRIPQAVVERFRPVFADLEMELRSGLDR